MIYLKTTEWAGFLTTEVTLIYSPTFAVASNVLERSKRSLMTLTRLSPDSRQAMPLNNWATPI